MNNKLLTILILLSSCSYVPWLSHISSGYRVTVAPWISESNANQVEKNGLWDGCSSAHTREFYPTSIRHISRIEMDSDYINDNEYKTAWRYGYYYCHINRNGFLGSYLRGWNIIGWKGAGIGFKS